MRKEASAGLSTWKIVPLSKGQLLDVRPEDIVDGGHFRICNTYRGGGGYDHFPRLAAKYFSEADHHLQFVVQLFGCNLDCPYCYVTRAGVWGEPVSYSSGALVERFNRTNATIFHLMGGAPALRLPHWPELLDALEGYGKLGWLFHSDLMLSEGEYDVRTLDAIARPRALYAVNIKGVTPEEYLKNTRKAMDEGLVWRNLGRLEECKVPYYITFTGIPDRNVAFFWKKFQERFGEDRTQVRRADAYTIPLIDYDSLPHVDEVPWGRRPASIRA